MLEKFYQISSRLLYILFLNPKFFFKRVFLELKYLFSFTKKTAIKNFNGVSFVCDFSYSQKMKKMYCGNYQPIISEVIKKYLKKGDTFIDVGANVGYFTALAAGLVGKTGQVHSFEPVREYFEKLDSLSKNNKEYKIKVNQIAIGDVEENRNIYIKGAGNIGNNTFFPDLISGDKSHLSVQSVPIKRLDKYIEENAVKNIKLIKVDVDGYELSVFKSLEGYFKKCSSGNYPIIISEIFPAAYPYLGGNVKDVYKYMEKFSYHAFEIMNDKLQISQDKLSKNQVVDVVFKFKKKL